MQDSLFVSVEQPLQTEISSLLKQSDAVAATLYPGEYRRPITAESLAKPDTHVIVARIAGRTAGLCVLFDRGDRSVELKRKIVDSDARGAGVGKALLRGAETHALKLGAETILLEVGTRNVEAQQLYRRAGFQICEPFSPYKATPISLFMVSHLKETDAGLSAGR